VPVQATPVPAIRRPSPAAEAVGAVVVGSGTVLLRRATSALVQAVGQWLADRSADSGTFPERVADASAEPASGSDREGGGRGGRRARHRRRGR
jgi:hypothetical protein